LLFSELFITFVGMKPRKIYYFRRYMLGCCLFLCCAAGAQVNTNRVLTVGKNALYYEDYVLSIQYFNQVIKAKPYLAEPYLYRALAKLKLDDYAGAENDCVLCLERNPFLVYAYLYRGVARQSMNDYAGAIQDYDKGLELQPEDRQLLHNKAIAYLQSEQYDSALATLDTLLEVQPRYLYAYLTRGAAYCATGDTAKAMDDFNYALTLDKYSAPAYARRGIVYYQQQDYEQALKDFNQAIYLDTRQAAYYINRGLVRYYLNDLRGAMADYDAVVAMDSRNLIARFNRGLLRSQVGDVYGALEDFNYVITVEPDNFMAIYNRAILHNEATQYQEAIEDLNTVIAEYPNFVTAYYFKAEIKRKMKLTKEADADYWQAFQLEQKLQKEREQGKIVTGKKIYDSAEEASAIDDDDNKTRARSDKDIDKFNRLVVLDKDEEIQSSYQTEIRGRVQDRQVKADLEPQFVLTYYTQIAPIDRSVTYSDTMINNFNAKNHLAYQLKIVNREAALTDEQVALHFQSIDQYSLTIDRNPTDAYAYFGRALDFMVVQDLSEAIDDFGRAIQCDEQFAEAYFNRAVV